MSRELKNGDEVILLKEEGVIPAEQEIGFIFVVLTEFVGFPTKPKHEQFPVEETSEPMKQKL